MQKREREGKKNVYSNFLQRKRRRIQHKDSSVFSPFLSITFSWLRLYQLLQQLQRQHKQQQQQQSTSNPLLLNTTRWNLLLIYFLRSTNLFTLLDTDCNNNNKIVIDRRKLKLSKLGPRLKLINRTENFSKSKLITSNNNNNKNTKPKKQKRKKLKNKKQGTFTLQ